MIELLRRFGRPFRALIVAAPLMKVVEAIFDLLTPLVIANMVDAGIRAGDMAVVQRSCLMLAAMAVLGFTSTLACQKMAGVAAQGMGTDMRNALYGRISELSPADLDRLGTSTLLTRLTSDVNQVQLGIAMALRTLLRWPLIALGSIVAAFSIDFALGCIFLASMALVAGVFLLVMTRSVPLFARIQQLMDALVRIARENLAGARQVRAFTATDRERDRFDASSSELASSSIRVGMLSGSLSPATMLVLYGAVCLILLMGGARVDAGTLTTGQVIAFVSYMTQALLSITYLANLIVLLTRAHASSARIVEALDVEPTVVGGARQLEPIEGAPAIALRSAALAYPEAAGEALRDVAVEVAPGACLGVIGATGSGKTSLGLLAARLYDATGGAVELFGHDVRDYPFAQLRALVSVVPQQSSLVSGTIASNLRWRNPDATEDELWRALDLAQADFVREMEGGLEAHVEAHGANLSGGQRQRLCIARALVGGPSVVVLDDAASALDMVTDARLREALAGLGNTTRIIISQRVASVRDADAICVLDEGQAVGLGTHDELLQGCPLYREICDLQLGGEGAVS